MIRFQWLMVAPLAALALREIMLLGRGVAERAARLLRFAGWTAAAAAILMPSWVQSAATIVGIGRGSDLVLYSLALAFLGTSFYFYAREERLERDVSALARAIAIATCRRGPAEPTVDTEGGGERR